MRGQWEDRPRLASFVRGVNIVDERFKPRAIRTTSATVEASRFGI